jgi:hypothetical protein
MVVIFNPEGRIWIDQGWAVGTAGIAWALVRFGGDFHDFLTCLPTLCCCLIGGTLAGIAASTIKKKHQSFTAPKETVENGGAA